MAGLALLAVFAVCGLSCVPFGKSHRSIADRLAPRSPANEYNNKIG